MKWFQTDPVPVFGAHWQIRNRDCTKLLVEAAIQELEWCGVEVFFQTNGSFAYIFLPLHEGHQMFMCQMLELMPS